MVWKAKHSRWNEQNLATTRAREAPSRVEATAAFEGVDGPEDSEESRGIENVEKESFRASQSGTWGLLGLGGLEHDVPCLCLKNGFIPSLKNWSEPFTM
ncbi:hypothetical protein RHGRI_021788 [Rhododendron griersonianum]|uniref:Uncharacterized protein n=1 Tax=Rhododendron griersonianum TaxID=479676 RepID=A0AAV6JLH0_9ERIC|nr:hypothetical protein RHGRI_021788 [Rhododendron griersonianum]